MIDLKTCDWCGAEAVGEVELIPAKYKNLAGSRVLMAPAKTANVCKKHKNIVRDQPLFYTCGCTYVKNNEYCPYHLRKLKNADRARRSSRRKPKY